MNINELLSNVKNVDEYISITQEIIDKCKNTKVQINITIVLALKQIKSLEIEYFNNRYKNGAACILFERLLSLPPSKTWGVLGRELVSLLQYWLEAIRKYQINHTVHWGSFLKLILKFIKEICLKDPSMPNILVELTAESLFDIASKDNPDAQQRHEILHCLNAYSAESSREIRFAMRNKFGEFFTKLASHLATSGYHPCQYSTLEALVRWLVPRNDRRLRTTAAARWFPEDLCPDAAREIFLTTNWMNFYQDARDFLNVLNEANGLVTSVVCRRLSVGKIIIISGAEKQQTWLDFNSSGKSISVLLNPKVLEIVGIMGHRTYETLIITDENTQTAQLHSLSQELTISLNTIQPPRVQPLDVVVGDASDVNIVVSSSVDLRKLDAALRSVFGEKYRLLVDVDTHLSLSPPKSREIRKKQNSSEEDTRFSHPVEVKRKRHAGYMIRPKNAGAGVNSPSTASTSSLAQLHDKLEALPRYRYDRGPVSVCAQPELSSVTEISEVDDRSFHSISTLKFRQVGVCYNKRNTKTEPLAEPTKKRAESDSETLKLKPKLRRPVSPVVSDDNSASCLLVATVGSADDSVINDTVERISKNKDFNKYNIVDLLVQEALQAKPITKEKLIDSGINSVDNKSQEKEENSVAVEAIENTPVQDDDKETRKKSRKKICTIVSKSTIYDECSTEAVNETPNLINPRQGKLSRRQSCLKAIQPKVADKQSFDIRTVEEFFSQHFTDTKAGEIVISPTLARKINESSSESSETFVENFLNINEVLSADVEQFEFNDIGVMECLNNMVDKVCSDLEKQECTQYLNRDDDLVVSRNDSGLVDNQTHVIKETNYTNTSLQQTDSASRPKRNIKLTFKAKKERKPRTVSKKSKNITEKNLTKKMSTIIEQTDEEVLAKNSPNHHVEDVEATEMNSPVIEKTKNVPPVEKTNVKTPVTKRKRKLYSPKDDEIENERKGIKISETDDDDIVLSKLKTRNRGKKLKTTATCYKEIERERQKHIKLPRLKKCGGKVEELPSPRSLKMNAVFDNLKLTVESEENINFAGKMTAQSDIYDFTSESEEEDFKKKKIEVQQRSSATTVGNFEFTMSARRGRQRTRINYSEKSSNDDDKKSENVRTKTTKKTNSKTKSSVNNKSVIELEDERMRGAVPDELNTSVVIENPKTNIPAKVELALHVAPEMELITDKQENIAHEKKNRNKKSKKAEMLSLKKERGLKNEELILVSDKEDDRTVSPLPGLVIESMPTRKDDANDLVAGTMLQKLKKIYQEGTDVINEYCNTQNMLLSDIERCNYSPRNVSVNNTNEICFVDCNKKNIIETKLEKKKADKSKSNKNSEYFTISKDRKNIETENTSLSKDISSDVIEISELLNDKLEKSIATDSITAHGDFDEAPPSLDMIRKRMQPREIEDLNESMRDYFVKLNREIDDSTSKERRESSKSKEDAEGTNIIQTVFDESASVKSPVVSVQRLSFDDFSKWLPSRRTSDASSSARSSENIHKTSEPLKSNKKLKSNLENVRKKIPVNNVSKNKNQQVKPIVNYPEIKSPILPRARMTLEEFDNWLPMSKSLEYKGEVETNKSSLQKETRQSGVKILYNTRQKSKNTKDVKNLDVTEQNIAKKLKSESLKHSVLDNKSKALENTPNNISEIDSDFTSNRVRVSSRKRARNITTAMKTKGTVAKNTNNGESDNHSELKAMNKRSSERNNSVISPIQVTDIINDESSEDQCIKKIRDIFSKEKTKSQITGTDNKLKKSTQETQSPDSTPTKIKFMSSQDSIRKVMRAQDSTSTKEKEIEHESISTKVDEPLKCPIKRQSSPILGQAKTMRFETKAETVTIESGPSITSVRDWFRRIEPSTSNANYTSRPFRDVIQHIMEKLDTTLVENNRNTSKKLVNMFVEAQKQLSEQQEERRQTYKTVATQVITEIVSVIDAKFVDLDRRSQQMTIEFKEHLKKQAFDLIREDCHKKRVMVSLLKEDVQAVLDYIERIRSSP